jgi:TRAP-type mannitol/chloroaromatic compound transport system permease small subunit
VSQKQSALRKAMAVVDAISLWSGRIVCVVTLIIMAVLLREVIGRYFFNAPTSWANEINQYLLCVLTLLGGAYCFMTNSHIRVDIFWLRYTPRTQALVELLTAIFPIIFLVVVFWAGIGETWSALAENKRSASLLAMPLWPSMLAVPVGTGLMLLQLLVRLIRDVLQLISGRDEHPPTQHLLD